MDTKFDIKELIGDYNNLPLSEELDCFNSQNRLLDSNDDMRDLSPPPTYPEETLDVAMKFENAQIQHIEFPVSKIGPPERGNFSGDLNFEIAINGCDSHKKKYTYSKKLNRLYVAMGPGFPMQFSWNWERSPRPMYVRATVVFSDESQAEKRVERCLQHLHDPNNSGLHPAVIRNVLRSSREPGTQGVYYCGEPEKSDSWYSILVEYQAPPTVDSVCSHVYQFVCKNSCNSGINRRATDIIFTLEDALGQVYGRSTMGVRACACPRRDMRKDETDVITEQCHKRPLEQRPPNPPGKRPRLDALTQPDEKIIDVNINLNLPMPGIKVIGTTALAAGLSVTLALMENAAAYNKKIDRAAAEKYDKPIADLRAVIGYLKKSE